MKKTAAALIIAVACLFAPACNDKNDRADKKNVIAASEVPATVKNAFESKHSDATDIIWEDAHEGDVKTYKVKFKSNDKYMKAEYKEDGSLVKEDIDK
jgi:hypothetical protein